MGEGKGREGGGGMVKWSEEGRGEWGGRPKGMGRRAEGNGEREGGRQRGMEKG